MEKQRRQLQIEVGEADNYLDGARKLISKNNVNYSGVAAILSRSIEHMENAMSIAAELSKNNKRSDPVCVTE